MSSILDALKKLEKEKIHRDEVSTAIASDILRSESKTKEPQWKIPLVLFVLVIIVSILAILLFRKPAPVPTVQSSIAPQAEVVKAVEPEPAKVAKMVAAVKPMPDNLPLLSGIVYQQQKDARMAILNDLPVMEGTVIAGYTLQEIFPNYVVLIHKGQSFSIPLDPDN